MIISWMSGGVTSAVACKMAQESHEDVTPVFIETGGHHQDMPRFIKDCEDWLKTKVMVLQDDRYIDHIDLCEKKNAVNFINGAACSKTLKKEVRQRFEKTVDFSHQVFGFEYDKKEINRAIRFKEQHPHTNPLFPLIDKKLNKSACMAMIAKAGIELPAMYRLGYSNNNCVGCVKGGMGYWNKIREDFPDTFQRMASVERKLGRTCINGVYLDELESTRGRHKLPPMPECDLFCEIEFANLESPDLAAVMTGEKHL